MTKLPAESWNVKGVATKEKAPKVGPRCANPACTRFADHAHHIWRRSFLGGDFAWVELPEGDIICNLIGLCFGCHAQITENKAWIRLRGESFHFVECDDEPEDRGPLIPQPVRLVKSPSPDNGDQFGGAIQLTTDGGEVLHSEVVKSAGTDGEAGFLCPTCKRRKRAPRKDLPPGEARRKVKFVFPVPQDGEEDGHEVLTVLIEECADVLGRGEQPIYYTLAEVAAFFLQHAHMLTQEEVYA